jgi:hypothetical protein
MGEYELWATGVGELVRLREAQVEVMIDQECEGLEDITIRYVGEKYVNTWR